MPGVKSESTKEWTEQMILISQSDNQTNSTELKFICYHHRIMIRKKF